MLPSFSRRLQQREFDLILVAPVRRRILLKMFAVACFLRAGRVGAYERGIRRLWKSPSLGDVIMDEGFHEEYENVILMKDISKRIFLFSNVVNASKLKILKSYPFCHWQLLVDRHRLFSFEPPFNRL